MISPDWLHLHSGICRSTALPSIPFRRTNKAHDGKRCFVAEHQRHARVDNTLLVENNRNQAQYKQNGHAYVENSKAPSRGKDTCNGRAEKTPRGCSAYRRAEENKGQRRDFRGNIHCPAGIGGKWC